MFKGILAPEESKAEWDFLDMRGRLLKTTVDTSLQAGVHWTVLPMQLVNSIGRSCAMPLGLII